MSNEFVLVPVEPTAEMLEAGAKGSGEDSEGVADGAYRAMLSARPAPPEGDDLTASGDAPSLAAGEEELRDSLKELLHVVCGETGFASAVRAHSKTAYPWPGLDIAESKAREVLSRLQPAAASDTSLGVTASEHGSSPIGCADVGEWHKEQFETCSRRAKIAAEAGDLAINEYWADMAQWHLECAAEHQTKPTTAPKALSEAPVERAVISNDVAEMVEIDKWIDSLDVDPIDAAMDAAQVRKSRRAQIRAIITPLLTSLAAENARLESHVDDFLAIYSDFWGADDAKDADVCEAFEKVVMRVTSDRSARSALGGV